MKTEYVWTFASSLSFYFQSAYNFDLFPLQVESLKYLSYCTLKYGSDRMSRHAEVLWFTLKDILYTSPQSALSLESESAGVLGLKGTDIMDEAVLLLQELTRQNGGSLLNFILSDEEINTFINSFTQHKDVNDIPLQRKQRLHAIGLLLSVSAKSSASFCNRVFEKFFPHLMETLGLLIGNPSENDYHVEDNLRPARLNFEALYLCVELLDASRYLVVGMKEPSSVLDFGRQTCCSLLHGFSRSLTRAFLASIETVDVESNSYVYLTGIVCLLMLQYYFLFVVIVYFH